MSNNSHNNKIIAHLIEKFFEGETSIDEERMLYRYFRSDSVSPELEQYRSLFDSLASFDTSGVKVSARTSQRKTFALPHLFAPRHSEQAPYANGLTEAGNRYRRAIGVATAVAVIFGSAALYNRYYDKRLYNLYGGSYIIVNGERVDNLKSIKSEIEKTLYAASSIEDKAYTDNVIDKAEEAVLRNIGDDKEREMVYKLLND